MGFYKNGKWRPDATEIAAGELVENERKPMDRLEEENKRLHAELKRYRNALEKIANVRHEYHAAWGTSASIAMRDIAKQALEEK